MAEQRTTLWYREMKSAVTAIAAGDTLDVDVVDRQGDRAPGAAHCFAACEFYSDAGGTTVVIPTSGTITFTIVSPVLPNQFLSITNGAVDVSTNGQADWASPTLTVRVAGMSGITAGTATHYRMRVFCLEA